MIVSGEFKAIYDASVAFMDRDRRRLKREVRKSLSRYYRDHPDQRPSAPKTYGGIDRATNAFWRTSSSTL
jgi:hypothetical protein